MDNRATGPRLFVTRPLSGEATLRLDSAPAHYLRHVMRLGAGDAVRLFNGADGEWQGCVIGYGRESCEVRLGGRLRPQTDESGGPWLAFAPLKKAPLEYLIVKATELGVARLLPVTTAYTAVTRTNIERMRQHAVEAAEQTGRLSVPPVDATVSLARFIETWPRDRRLYICHPEGDALPIARALIADDDDGPDRAPAVGFLIGPEGGLAASDLDLLAALPLSTRIALGPRLLRAETAAAAVLACWQAVRGDWRRL